jgi:hypothetical protein
MFAEAKLARKLDLAALGIQLFERKNALMAELSKP